jgi:hypothetical protein
MAAAARKTICSTVLSGSREFIDFGGGWHPRR